MEGTFHGHFAPQKSRGISEILALENEVFAVMTLESRVCLPEVPGFQGALHNNPGLWQPGVPAIGQITAYDLVCIQNDCKPF